MTEKTDWTKSSWRNFTALQQPNWPDEAKVDEVLQTISNLPPLVFAGEIRDLKLQLAKASAGEAFLLQGGDCSEEFARCTAPNIRETLKVLLQMAVILTYAGGKPVVKVGRIAGQYAKPRSSDTEMVNGMEIPSYRGDMVNSVEPTPEARIPNPENMLKGYYLAASTLNLLRAFTRGGFAALHRVQAWNQEFVKQSPMGRSYERLAKQISQAINFMQTIGIPTDTPQFRQAQFFTSHEALLLGYEEALTREDSTTGGWYDCSAHMLWIGDRTRQIDGAHIEFLRGVLNPVGMKVGPRHDIDEILAIIEKLNPDNEPGRMTLITRFGAREIEKYLPPLLRAIKKEGINVVWSCDPMHANIRKTRSGHKTRSFDDILSELRCFFELHWAEGTVPGGVHFELTGDDVTECTGGARQLLDDQLGENYLTTCDPRLNAEQSLEMAFQIAEMIRS
ncbi:phospho-2-dehydro-3-deoxyheptonate aldolase [Desulfolithobacter dissulfuricans]|uniref:Phospho-2-dehydro-3-deoxyheptonate aldolase n=1 Tax=Desulfolithobacter dissulfuricans TaxID=2795293 RepID=A0A915XJU7_9BACT|nr:3-deoxy-7-phosphoheptulonate synthase class II [Desulfolithobacter dissulfuricans]BCO10795.1 phospho-2-dehydro-3-deoxyheptonate aldolase [Desulfolithobacter dissulfuricans]